MIKIEHTIIPSPQQMIFVIEGMRNPLNSWALSDSAISEDGTRFIFGPKDRRLAKRLSEAGSDHRKYLRQMPVMCRITAPLYWWKEFDTYKVGTVSNSCSTMHKIHDKEFVYSDFSHEHLDVPSYIDVHVDDSAGVMFNTIYALNFCREHFLKTKDKYWWNQIIQLLPSSYNQTRNVSLNYEVLRNMYHARKGHKLDEWNDLCKWIEELPYSDLIL